MQRLRAQDDIGIGSAEHDVFGLLRADPLSIPGPEKPAGGALPIRAGSWAEPRSTQHFEQATNSFQSCSHTFGPGEPSTLPCYLS